MKQTILALLFSTSFAVADQFPIEGGERGGKRVVVSYDPKTPDIGDSGADLLLLDRDGKTVAKFPPLNADWSWTGQNPEKTVYSIQWTENGSFIYVSFRTGRILSGFSVFRIGEESVTEIDVGGTVGSLYDKGRIGEPPRSPNNSGVHAITWITSTTLLCDIQTADDTFFVTVTITKKNVPRITNIFHVSEPSDEQ